MKTNTKKTEVDKNDNHCECKCSLGEPNSRVCPCHHHQDQTSDWREDLSNLFQVMFDASDTCGCKFCRDHKFYITVEDMAKIRQFIDLQEQCHQREMEKMRKKYLHNTIAWQKASFVIGGDDLLDQTIEIKNKFVSKELKLNECIKYLLPDEDQISQSIKEKL